MKKIIIKTISVMLVLVLSMFSLASCINWVGMGGNGIFPDGYTGGYEIPSGSGIQYWWVETYEEALEAIDLLKSHGSTFYESTFFTYDGDLFDTKFCFTMYQHSSDRIKYGDNPFDRKAERVRVSSAAFFKDVTIEELVYSHIVAYDVYELGVMRNFEYSSMKDLAFESLDREWINEKYLTSRPNNIMDMKLHVFYEESNILVIDKWGASSGELSDECIDAMLSTIEFIGYEDQ